MLRRSLHLGVDTPDPEHYGSDVAPLAAAGPDALAWHAWARGNGWQAGYPLVDRAATTTALAAWVDRAVADAVDQVLITWSGHGTQIDRPPSTPEEADGLDETWVMWDRMLLDDEVAALMARFPATAQVCVIADSCHSLGSYRLETERRQLRTRAVRGGRSARVVARHPQLYQDARLALPPSTTVVAAVVGLAACREDESALESDGQGHFTAALLQLLGTGRHSYAELVAQAAALTPGQHPRAFWYGYDRGVLDAPALR